MESKREHFKAKDFYTLKVKDFFEMFKKRKIKFNKKVHFNTDLNTRKRNVEIDQKLYESILSEYFDIYFKELYFLNGPKYFFLSGFIEKGQTKKYFHYKMDRIQETVGIGFIWYQRPALSYLTNIMMRKAMSPLHKLKKIEVLYRKHNDPNELKKTKDILENKTQVNKQIVNND